MTKHLIFILVVLLSSTQGFSQEYSPQVQEVLDQRHTNPDQATTLAKINQLLQNDKDLTNLDISALKLNSIALRSNLKVSFDSTYAEWLDTKQFFDSLNIKKKYPYLLIVGAHLLDTKGRYDEMSELILQAKEKLEQGYKVNTFEKMSFHHSIGWSYQYNNQFNLAVENYSEGIKLCEKLIDQGENQYSALIILRNNISNSYAEIGDLVLAEKNCLKAISLAKKHGFKKFELAILQNLGLMYDSMGQYQKALDCTYKSIDQNTEDSPQLAHKYSNLGIIYKSLNQLDSAEYFLTKGYNMLKNFVGEDNRELLLDLDNLSILFFKKEEFKKANKFITKSLEIYHETGDTSSVYYTHALAIKSDLLMTSKQYPEALEILDKEKRNLDKLYREPNEDYLFNLAKTSVCNLYTKNYVSANNYTERFLDEFYIYFKSNIEILTESNYVKFENKNKKLLNIIYQHLHLNPNVSNETYTNLVKINLLQKGLAFEREKALKNLIKSNQDKSTLQTNWLKSKQDLLKGYSQNLNPIAIKEKEEKVSALTKELYLTDISQYLNAHDANLTEIQNKLSENDIILEIGLHKNLDSIKQYHCFAITHNELTYIPLFNSAQLEKKIGNSKEFNAGYVDQLYGSEVRGLNTEEEQITLNELILKPLNPYLENKNNIYYSPDGFLHRINLAAIALNDFEIVADLYDVHLIGSSRNLVKEQENINYPQSAGIIGGLDFVSSTETGISRGASSEKGWKKLKWTEKETDKISQYLDSKNYELNIFKGMDAQESILKKALSQANRSPRVLHIATHGFFLNENPLDKSNMFARIKNPMMRSGLIFSNGNKGWFGKHDPNEEDNIITAAEISEMDLSHTELVVLSACETGLGDITDNQGVFGLQRAFKLAGAKYIIMSLWQVPDRETSAFMIDFYKNWIEGNLSIREAFNLTQKNMRDRFFNPFQWAGFVLIE